MSLTKEKRDALDDSDFAVPETRQLPIKNTNNDKIHTRMAWQMLDRTKGLTDEQRNLARERILRRAHELGMDTSEWENHKASDDNDDEYFEGANFSFSALAMEIPDKVVDHPNQVPFKGVLTKLDEPSDNPLNGSNGKRVVIPKGVAEEALPSLLGMAIDFTDDLTGHDVKKKIGLITEANIIGNEIQIAGFFYGADFPDEVKRIHAEKAQLGFSYEAQARVRNMNDDPLVVKNCVFTGAAVLYKDCAAYTTTSLTAKSEKTNMNDKAQDKPSKGADKPAIESKVVEMLESISSRIEKIEASMEKKADKIEAGSVQAMIKPHADALRNCAAGMQAAGIGMHAERGHVNLLNKMADHMEAQAVLGQVPHIYQAPDFLYAGKADEKKDDIKTNSTIKDLKDAIAGITSQLSDIQKQQFHAASEPERKTITPAIAKLLAKAGITADDAEGKKLTVEEVDKLLANKGLPVATRIAAKMELKETGRMV